MGQRHFDVVEWPEPKSLRIISGSCEIAASLASSLKTRQSSTIAGEPHPREVDGGTEVRVGGSGEVEVMNVIRLSTKDMIFCKSKKQAFESALLVSREKFQFFSHLSF